MAWYDASLRELCNEVTLKMPKFLDGNGYSKKLSLTAYGLYIIFMRLLFPSYVTIFCILAISLLIGLVP